jgi:hypothetical protein
LRPGGRGAGGRKGAGGGAKGGGRGKGNHGTYHNEPSSSQQAMPGPKSDREQRYAPQSKRREAPKPSGSKGHPWSELGATWQSGGGPTDWDSAMLDVREMKELARFSGMQQAIAQCWPTDATCTAIAPFEHIILDGRPEGGWPADHCKYCMYRTTAPANTPDDQKWYYGTGDGQHDAVRCQALRRFVAEGGNAKKFPDAAKHLTAGGLRFGVQYSTKHKPASK